MPQTETIDVRTLVRGAVTGLSDKATRSFINDETLVALRNECPG